ncbi:kelch-like protein 28 isoform 1-T2 [Glossina fuscipes fuscipes]
MAAKIVNQVERVSEKKCKNSDYGSTFLNGLTKMRMNQKFLDFSLDIDGELIHVHKLTLAIASDYFAAMFEADMKERKEGTVKLQDVDVDAVKALVEYIYSGIITLTEANVEAVLCASDVFQIAWVKEECIQFLKNSLNQKNCFRVRKLAEMHSCKELQNISQKYILDHLDDLIAEEDLLLLSFEEIKELIKDMQHLVKPEDIAYKAAINWVKHDLEKRKVHLAEFMSQICLPLVGTEFLTNHIVAEPLLIENQNCYKFVMEALTYQLTKASERNERRQTDFEQRNENFYVFLGGGTRDLIGGIKECKVYDISKKKLVSISSMNEGRCDNSAVFLNGKVFSMGGFNRGALKTAECYDPASKRWSYIAPMNNTRHGFGICTYNHLIYVVGGYQTSTVESYDPATNKWHLCQNIPVTTNSHNRATVAENNIYSLTQGSKDNNALLRFDPRDGKWINLNEMPRTSDLFGLVSYDRTLFAIGNVDCKRLDVRVNRWEPMPRVLVNKYEFSTVIAAKDIYLFGDRSIERFNIHSNEWVMHQMLANEHHMGGAAILSRNFNFN